MHRNQAVFTFWNRLRKLAKTKSWIVCGSGAIRTHELNCDCPIVAVYNDLYPHNQKRSSYYQSAAAAMGLTYDYTHSIVLAADTTQPDYLNMRAKLKRALRLA